MLKGFGCETASGAGHGRERWSNNHATKGRVHHREKGNAMTGFKSKRDMSADKTEERPKEFEYQTQTAYTRALEEYCDALEKAHGIGEKE